MRRRILLTATTAALMVGSALAAPAAIHADPPVARDAGVIVRWNEITERTLIESGRPIPMWLVYLGFTSLAMYDAVVTIEGRYEPWSELPRAHAHASPEVAAATAAYHVLSHYFPNSAAALTADYEAALAAIPNGVGKEHGIRVGEDAAAALIARRADDGLTTAVAAAPGRAAPARGVATDTAGVRRRWSARRSGSSTRCCCRRRRTSSSPAHRPWTAPSTPPSSPRSVTTAEPVPLVAAHPGADRDGAVPHRRPDASSTSTRSAIRSPVATSTSSTPPAPWPCSTAASPTSPSPAGGPSTTSSSGAR